MHPVARRALLVVACVVPLAALGVSLGARSRRETPLARAPHSSAPKPAPPPSSAASSAPTTTVTLPPPGAAESCPSDMVLVNGTYCEEVEQICVRWLDEPTLPFARCGDYKKPARCIGKQRPLRFCIDRFEYGSEKGGPPANYLSFVTAAKACKAHGKRLCLESEWTLACEGNELSPYPYGFSRETKCNQDRSDLYEPNARRQVLRDLRRAPSDASECKSPFGVYEMVGNVDELVQKDRGAGYPFRNALKGGWWMAGRNRCRPSTTAHDDHYKDMQTGARCCADVEPDSGDRAR
jgi:formylglycine-generating enzyme